MSARPFGCNLIRRPNAGGRTLLENWVEERATKPFDEKNDRQSILRNGHNNIISGETEENLNLTTTAEYYQIPEKPPGESEPGSLTKLRYQRALQQSEAIINDQNTILQKIMLRRHNNSFRCGLTATEVYMEMYKRKSQMEEERSKRENPLIPKPPKAAQCSPTWIQEKPLSVWSELQSKRRLVGGTAGPEFKRSAQYSTPIVHQMDEQVDVPCQQ